MPYKFSIEATTDNHPDPEHRKVHRYQDDCGDGGAKPLSGEGAVVRLIGHGIPLNGANFLPLSGSGYILWHGWHGCPLNGLKMSGLMSSLLQRKSGMPF